MSLIVERRWEVFTEEQVPQALQRAALYTRNGILEAKEHKSPQIAAICAALDGERSVGLRVRGCVADPKQDLDCRALEATRLGRRETLTQLWLTDLIQREMPCALLQADKEARRRARKRRSTSLVVSESA